MGLKLNPAILKDQAQSIIDNLKGDNQSLLHVLDTIEQFTGNTDLKSVAWDNMKAQLNNHEAVIQGLLCANEMVIQNSVTLCGSIGDEKLDEDELKDQIEHLEIANNNLSGIKISLESCIKSTASIGGDVSGLYNAVANYNLIIQLNDRKIEDLEEKIQKLYQIETQTNSLYSDAEALYSSVESGITAIKKSWDASVGEFNITGMDLGWKNAIDKIWAKEQKAYLTKYKWEVFREKYNLILEIGGSDGLSALKECFDNNYAFSLLKQGANFKFNKVGNKYYIQLSGNIIDSCMPDKWNNLESFLRKNIKDVDWKKSDIKKLINNGLELDFPLFENANSEALSKVVNIKKIAKGNKFKTLQEGFKNGWENSSKFWNDFSPSEYSKINWLNKFGKAAGAIGTVVTALDNVNENLMNEDGKFVPSWDGLQNTITDTGVDILAGVTSSATGAAIGSFFLPPLGTAIGAIAGIAVDKALEWDIFDFDGDGKKHSIVDGAKALVDDVCDGLGNIIDNLI